MIQPYCLLNHQIIDYYIYHSDFSSIYIENRQLRDCACVVQRSLHVHIFNELQAVSQTIEYEKILVMLVYGEYYGHVYEVYNKFAYTVGILSHLPERVGTRGYSDI